MLKDLKDLINKVHEWAGRPTKDGAKLLRDFAGELETKYEKYNEGLVAVFYDKKNKREVKSIELMKIKLIRNLVGCDDQEVKPSDRRYLPNNEYREIMDESGFESCVKHGIIQREDYPPFTEWEQEKVVVYGYPTEQIISDIGYKSEKCPSFCNWDNHCMESDLVFLRFE